jgi:DNA-binding transcriptional regulator YiaG
MLDETTIPAYLTVRAMLASGEARDLRKRHGLSQAVVAKHCGVNTQTIWRWERGYKHPPAMSPAFGRYINLLGDLAGLECDA